MPAAGGAGTVAVTSAAGCAWSARSNVDWITISEGASGTGNGTVRISIAASSGAPRTGTLTIAGRTFTVEQTGSCAYALSSEAVSVPATGGTGTVEVTTTAGWTWTASATAPWITVTAGASGSGGGRVAHTVAATRGGPETAR